MQIKICGITRLEDAQHAVAHGAGWLGFNFVPGGKRTVPIEVAASICAKLPPHVRRVGVFMNQQADEIQTVLKAVPLDVLQFHGNEAPALLEAFGLTKIKVFAVDEGFDAKVMEAYAGVADFYLFDSKVGAQTGGTGAAFDWSLLPLSPKPFFLAGGLGCDNIEAAISQAKPWGVDLNSKLESAPGVKDPVLVERCLKLIRDR